MSAAYIAGVAENLTEAEITFDRFHVMKLIGDAVNLAALIHPDKLATKFHPAGLLTKARLKEILGR